MELDFGSAAYYSLVLSVAILAPASLVSLAWLGSSFSGRVVLRSGTAARVRWCVVRGGVVVAGVAVGGMRIGRRACAPVAVAASSMIVMCSVRMVLVVVVCFHLLVDLVDVDTSIGTSLPRRLFLGGLDLEFGIR